MTADHGEGRLPDEEAAAGESAPREGAPADGASAEGAPADEVPDDDAPADGEGRPPDRRALVVGAVVALGLAVAAGAAFGLLPRRSDRPAASPEEQATERAVATLAPPEADPEPVEAHFPAIDGLESAEADEALVAGLEERLRPADDYAATRHRQLREAGQAVAVISLLRAGGDEGAVTLRREALKGLGQLFETVGETEVGGEDVVRGTSVDGAALLWLPDADSVLVVSAVDRGRAEAVLGEVVGAVRGAEADDDADDADEGEQAAASGAGATPAPGR